MLIWPKKKKCGNNEGVTIVVKEHKRPLKYHMIKGDFIP